MILRAHCSQAGLFSHINYLITVMDDRRTADIYVDWSEGILYRDDSLNLFEHLFEQLASRPANESLIPGWPHHRYTGSNAAKLYRESCDWRWRLHEWWRHLHVKVDLATEADQFCSDWTEQAIAVHVRNARIGTECLEGLAPTLADYDTELAHFDGLIFLSTDNEEAAEYFQSRYGSRLRTRPISRSPDMQTEFHLSTAQTIRDAQNCLVDALIMSRCSHLLHSVSNIATAVLYMNPSMSHSFVARGQVWRRGTAPAEMDRALVDSTLERGKPGACRQFFHTEWRDEIEFHDNGVFRRLGAPESGTWSHPAADVVELKWLNWEKERFRVIVPAKPLGEAASASGEEREWCGAYLPKVSELVLKLKGGVGNQMFQYAFGLARACELGVPLRLSWDDWYREYRLDIFGLALARHLPKPGAVISCCDNYDETILSDLRADLALVEESRVWIDGYFQNEKFFSPVAREIRRRFSLVANLPLAESGRPTVAVHVRLGDYRSSHTHPLCSSRYFATGMSIMRERLQAPVFLVFSESPQECREFIEKARDVHILPKMGEPETLAAMQSCNGMIIANSTFSWWPAWLSQSPHVVCPDRFLRDKAWDVCPEHWIRVPTE